MKHLGTNFQVTPPGISSPKNHTGLQYFPRNTAYFEIAVNLLKSSTPSKLGSYPSQLIFADKSE